MRTLAIAFAATVAFAVCAIDVRPSHADPGPWCHLRGATDEGGVVDCSLPSFQACVQERYIYGGTCYENPKYHAVPARRTQTRPGRER